MSYSSTIHYIEFVNPTLDDGYYAVPDNFEDFEDYVFERDDDGDEILPEGFVFLDEDEDTAKRIMALRLMTGDFESDVDNPYGDVYEIGGESCPVLVLTDDEADDAVDKELDNIIDDVLGIPENIRSYFDEKSWKRDALIDGRGHYLNHYDGSEEYETVTIDGVDETLYLYRQ